MNAPVSAPKLYDCRDAFAETIEMLAANDSRVVAVCNDSSARQSSAASRRSFQNVWSMSVLPSKTWLVLVLVLQMVGNCPSSAARPAF